MNEGHSTQDWKTELRHALMRYFNDGELRGLCFDIGLDYDNIAAEGKIGTVIEMIEYGLRTGTVIRLIELCEAQRPNVPWEGISFGAKEATMNVRPVGQPIRERDQQPYVPPVPVYNPTDPYESGRQNSPQRQATIVGPMLGWLVGGFGLLALLLGGSLIAYNFYFTAPTLVSEEPSVKLPDDAPTSTYTPTPIPPTSTQTPTAIPPTNTPTAVPPTLTPTPVVIVQRQGSSVVAPLNSQEAAGWFPQIGSLTAGGIREVKNADLYSGQTLQFMNSIGRLTSYERTYLHPTLCNSADGYEGVYIQMFYFSDVSGAQQFFTWATDNWTFPGVVPRSDVGNQSYYIKKNSTSLSGSECKFEDDSFTFQKQNVVYRVKVYTREGDSRWSDLDALTEAVRIARIADSQIP